jgi:hypothetical protein
MHDHEQVDRLTRDWPFQSPSRVKRSPWWLLDRYPRSHIMHRRPDTSPMMDSLDCWDTDPRLRSKNCIPATQKRSGLERPTRRTRARTDHVERDGPVFRCSSTLDGELRIGPKLAVDDGRPTGSVGDDGAGLSWSIVPFSSRSSNRCLVL